MTEEKSFIEEKWTTSSGLTAVCAMVHGSHRCGYVGVPKSHPAFEKHYDDDVLSDISVHGGLTFSEFSRFLSDGDKESLFYLGFDCAHLGDATKYFAGPDDVFRSKAYVKNECENLAKQLVDLK